jgi:hypothetical protein
VTVSVEARLVASTRLTRDVVRDVQAELLPGRTNKVILELSHSAAQLVECERIVLHRTLNS